MLRTACCRIRLSPQVASRVSSGRPYRKRISVRSITTPSAPATRNAAGTAKIRPKSVKRRGRGRDQLLHDKGGVGADHHHLAMRHVDDAHHPEGDGQPGRGEQQYGAEADAVIDVLEQDPRVGGAGRCRGSLCGSPPRPEPAVPAATATGCGSKDRPAPPAPAPRRGAPRRCRCRISTAPRRAPGAACRRRPGRVRRPMPGRSAATRRPRPIG